MGKTEKTRSPVGLSYSKSNKNCLEERNDEGIMRGILHTENIEENLKSEKLNNGVGSRLVTSIRGDYRQVIQFFFSKEELGNWRGSIQLKKEFK